eukprot:7971171-Pyramimonas_sp.AAC.1
MVRSSALLDRPPAGEFSGAAPLIKSGPVLPRRSTTATACQERAVDAAEELLAGAQRQVRLRETRLAALQEAHARVSR